MRSKEEPSTPVAQFWDQSSLDRIRNYRPGITLERFQNPQQVVPVGILCPVLGLASHGKSAWIESCLHAINGLDPANFYRQAPIPDVGRTYTQQVTPIPLTPHLTLVDTPGLLRSQLATLAQSQNPLKEWLQLLLQTYPNPEGSGFEFHNIYFVYSLEEIGSVGELKPFLMDFIRLIGTQPILLITNYDRVEEIQRKHPEWGFLLHSEEAMLRWVVGQLGCGLVYPMVNYTRDSRSDPRQNENILNRLVVGCAISDEMINYQRMGKVTFRPR